MPFDAKKNFGYTDITVAPSPATTGTSLTVTDGTVFPAVPFNATIWAVNQSPLNSNAEIVRVTAIATNVLTIARAQESSTARSVVVGDQIAATITAKSLTDIENVAVTSIGVTTANGVSGTSSGGLTPSLTIALAAITPTSVTASGFITNPGVYITDIVSNRGIRFQTSGVVRWFLHINSTAEGGSDAGSDFVLTRYNDAGASLGAALTIVRSTGVATFAATISGSITGNAGTVTNGAYINAAQTFALVQTFTLAPILTAGIAPAQLPNGLTNGNTARQSQIVVSATNYYITSSNLNFPATLKGGLAVGSRFKWRVAMDKTAAGTGLFQIAIYRGTNGSTADTQDVLQTIGTQTAVVDSMVVDVVVTITATGASGSYYWTIIPVNKAVTATGFGVATGTTGYFAGTVSAVALNTASLIFGLGFKATTGTPTISLPMVQARAENFS